MGERIYVKEDEPIIITAAVSPVNRKQQETEAPPPTEHEQTLILENTTIPFTDTVVQDVGIFDPEGGSWYFLLSDEEGRHYWDRDQPMLSQEEIDEIKMQREEEEVERSQQAGVAPENPA